MRNIKLRKAWNSLHSSYWFIPGLMTAAAIGFSFAMVGLDEWLRQDLGTVGWVYTRGPEGARAILSTIAGSMIGVAGVTFSITIVALSLASSQFGPRLLRNFMQDTGNQVTLGTFIATFIYCLLVLRTIREAENGETFVPHLAVVFSNGLAIASIGVLIYFIHHVATSIQVETIIAEVGRELDQNIERLFPTQVGHGPPEQRVVAEIPHDFDRNARTIEAPRSGYLQAINDEKLLELAQSHDLLVSLQYCPGKFIVRGCELGKVWPPQRVDAALLEKFNNLFILGKQRTEQQDVEFGINQLVEIAVRALSPGINDPFTAIRCIDQLSAALSHLATKEIPSPYRYDAKKNLRVIAKPVTFAGLTDSAFNQIRQYGSSAVAVMIRLLEAIAVIATQIHREQDRSVLLRHATMIQRDGVEAIFEVCDRTDIEERYQATIQALKRHRDSHD